MKQKLACQLRNREREREKESRDKESVAGFWLALTRSPRQVPVSFFKVRRWPTSESTRFQPGVPRVFPCTPRAISQCTRVHCSRCDDLSRPSRWSSYLRPSLNLLPASLNFFSSKKKEEDSNSMQFLDDLTKIRRGKGRWVNGQSSYNWQIFL